MTTPNSDHKHPATSPQKEIRIYIATLTDSRPKKLSSTQKEPVVLDLENAPLALSPAQFQILQKITALNLPNTDDYLDALEAIFIQVRCSCHNPLTTKECLVYTPQGIEIVGIGYASRKPSPFEVFLFEFDRLPPLDRYHFVLHQVCETCGESIFGAFITHKRPDEQIVEALQKQAEQMSSFVNWGLLLQVNDQQAFYDPPDLLFHPDYLAQSPLVLAFSKEEGPVARRHCEPDKELGHYGEIIMQVAAIPGLPDHFPSVWALLQYLQHHNTCETCNKGWEIVQVMVFTKDKIYLATEAEADVVEKVFPPNPPGAWGVLHFREGFHFLLEVHCATCRTNSIRAISSTTDTATIEALQGQLVRLENCVFKDTELEEA